MNKIKLVQIFTGEIFTPTVVHEQEFWFSCQLKKDGNPSGKARSNRIGIEECAKDRGFGELGYRGRFAEVESYRELVATGIRSEIEKLEESLLEAKRKLAQLYVK
jgi:hypothetical protein